MNRTEVGRIVPGAVYRLHALRKVRRDGLDVVEDVEGHLYRVEGFLWHGLTMQELVHYVGVDGPDGGRGYVCSPWDFAIKFRPHHEPDPAPVAAPAAAAEPAPERMAGFKSDSVHL